jgi:hypothetical protein
MSWLLLGEVVLASRNFRRAGPPLCPPTSDWRNSLVRVLAFSTSGLARTFFDGRSLFPLLLTEDSHSTGIDLLAPPQDLLDFLKVNCDNESIRSAAPASNLPSLPARRVLVFLPARLQLHE